MHQITYTRFDVQQGNVATLPPQNPCLSHGLVLISGSRHRATFIRFDIFLFPPLPFPENTHYAKRPVR